MGFSVLLSVYYKEKPEYLRASLMSILEQTLLPDEIVLVKDGPLTESLDKVISEMAEKYPIIKVCALDKNVQLGRALSFGVEVCKYELIARMDTDDIAVNNRFEMQYQYMLEHPEIAVSGGFIEEFNDNSAETTIKKMPIDDKQIHKYMRYRNPLNHMTVMFRKSAVLNAGNYQHFPFLEDYHLWNRVYANGGKLSNIPEVLVRARTSDAMYERRGGIKYGNQYLKLRKMQHQLKITNMMEYVIGCILSLAISFQSGAVRKLIYVNILRKNRK